MHITKLLFILGLAGCAIHSSSSISVETEITKFMPNSHNMEFDGGRCWTFDVAQLRLLAPKEREGEILFVSIPQNSTNVFLQNTGAKCRFKISPEFLSPLGRESQDIFEGALEDLTPLE